jgi:hypothetical protein
MGIVADLEGPDFFHIMGISMRQGGEFDTQDDASSTAVAVISEAMAHRYWPKGDAISSNVIVDKRPRRIVGILRDYAYSDPANTDPELLLFLPLARTTTRATSSLRFVRLPPHRPSRRSSARLWPASTVHCRLKICERWKR